MNITIFSKDRACQLDFLLKSMEQHFVEYKDTKINVIIKYKNDLHKRAYEKLFCDFPNIHKIIESPTTSFKQLTLKSLDVGEKYTTFFVDDNVFKNRFSMKDPEVLKMCSYENLCVSLRMCEGMNYCHSARFHYNDVPKIRDGRWEWRGYEGDWGYPMSLDGHIFRTADVTGLLHRIPFNNPNELEYNMSLNPFHQDYMVCYKESVIFNNPLNRVHNNNNTPHANVSEDMLAEMYLSGKKIKLSKDTKDIKFTSPHFDIPIVLI